MEKTSNNNKVKRICITGLMAALICVATAFIKMPTGINSGYLHFGDSMIYLAGCLLGPWASLAAAIGGALADVISSAPQWAPATAIIKAINAVPFILVVRNTNHKIITKWTVLMTVVSGLWTIGGYLVAEGIMYSFPTALTSVPFSCVQALGSAIVFVIVGAILDKIKIQKYI